MAFSAVEPFGFHAQWAPFAHLLAMVANVNRDPKKSKRYKAEDFMPKEPRDEMGWQDMMQHARTVTEMLGGQTKKGT